MQKSELRERANLVDLQLRGQSLSGHQFDLGCEVTLSGRVRLRRQMTRTSFLSSRQFAPCGWPCGTLQSSVGQQSLTTLHPQLPLHDMTVQCARKSTPPLCRPQSHPSQQFCASEDLSRHNNTGFRQLLRVFCLFLGEMTIKKKTNF